MKIIKALQNNMSGKTKKSILGTMITVLVIGGVVSIFFGGGTSLIGLLISAAILVVVVGAVYFILKATDDLPDAFAN